MFSGFVIMFASTLSKFLFDIFDFKKTHGKEVEDGSYFILVL